MGSLQYTEDSWLGEVPRHWPIVPSKSLFANPVERNHGDDIHLTPSQKFGVIPQSEYMEITGSRVVLNLSGADNMRHVEPGDFVSHLRSFQGGLEYSPHKGKVSSAYTVLRPKRQIEPRFYKYLFKSSRYVQGLATTTEQLRDGQSIRYQQFSLLPLPYPPIEEQKAIADFLDRELAQIDTLVQKMEEFVAALRERLHSEMVNVASRDLGQASREGWSVKKIGSIFKVIGSGTTPTASDESNFGGQTPWVTTSELRENHIFETEKYVSDRALHNFSALRIYPAGSLVLALYGATIGRIAFLGVPATVNQACCVMAKPRKSESRFIYYALQANRDRLMAAAVGSGQPNISQEIVRQFRLALPPQEEQKNIVSALDRAVESTQALIEAAQKTIHTIGQRRQGLVNAAVTGKIDAQGRS